VRGKEREQSAAEIALRTEPRWRAWVVSPRRGLARVRRQKATHGVEEAPCSLDVATQGATSCRRVRPDSNACNARKARCPQPWGEHVGGVSGKPTRETEGEILHVSAVANGGRHPDPRDVGNRRGLTEERGSWSVRPSAAGLVPLQALAPMTTGVLWKKRRGTSSACVMRTHSTCRNARKALRTLGDTSFTRSRDPRTSNSVSDAQASETKRSRRYRGRANLRKQEQPDARGRG
jgi:hypothetical protein